jgi:glycosyltransferase involved in cell wall biosynthesis
MGYQAPGVMKILYVSYSPPGGGHWVHTGQFFSALQRLHPNVAIYPPRSQDSALRGSLGAADNGKRPPLLELRFLYGFFLRRLRREYRLLREEKPDVVVLRAGGSIALVPLTRLMGIPLLLELNASITENKLRKPSQRMRWPAFWRWLENWFIKKSSHVSVVSNDLRQIFLDRGHDPAHISAVANGVDVDMFQPAVDDREVRRRLGLTGKTIIGFSGNFARWHGLDFLLDASERLFSLADDLAILLIGRQGSSYTLPENLDQRVVVTGFIPHQQMPEHLAAVDIFVAPYPLIQPFHFSPLKIFEAMAMGKPVVASAQGQISELITHRQNGMLYEPGDQAGFVNCVSELIADPDLRRRLGDEARRTMREHYTWTHNAGKILDICRGLHQEAS